MEITGRNGVRLAERWGDDPQAYLGITVPEFLMKSVDLAKDGAIPVMLVILGIELARVTIENDRSVIALATFTKLILVPVFAFPLAALMGMTGVTRAVCIIEASPESVRIALDYYSMPGVPTALLTAVDLANGAGLVKDW